MSMVSPIRKEPEQVRLAFVLPKEKHGYKVTSPKFHTDAPLEPLMRVKITGSGFIGHHKANFDSNTGEWTVVLDDCELEVDE
jgi:hypothetical protein